MKKKLQAEVERLKSEIERLKSEIDSLVEALDAERELSRTLNEQAKKLADKLVLLDEDKKKLIEKHDQIEKERNAEIDASFSRNRDRESLLVGPLARAYQACVDLKFMELPADASPKLQAIKTALEGILGSPLMKKEWSSTLNPLLVQSMVAVGAIAFAARFLSQPNKEKP